MKASYKKLWKLLVDKEMSKGDLHKASGLSSSTMTKLRKGEAVSMEALSKDSYISIKYKHFVHKRVHAIKPVSNPTARWLVLLCSFSLSFFFFRQ